jgi:hypothetical protein
MRRIRVGDVMKTKSGDLRVVRYVSYRKTSWGERVMVAFAIRNCSWTGGCDTFLTASELAGRGFRPTGHRVRLNRQIDKLIAAEVGKKTWRPRKIGCCDVKGVP